jgi:uncharacterized repeat protein (TIGR02543 family)
VVRTEIVHIYSGIETRWDYDFSVADFGIPIEISGSIDLSGLTDVSWTEVILYRYEDYTYQEASFSGGYNPSSTWLWTVRMLPFNQPTDLYVELRVYFNNGGVLTKRLSSVSVYNEDYSVPEVEHVTVNQFSLSGVVDFSSLASKSITPTDAYVSVYPDGSTSGLSETSYWVDLQSGAWNGSLYSEEAALSVRLVLVVSTSGNYSYHEYPGNPISISSDRTDLNFTPEAINVGTTINGVSTSNYDYRYLFIPDVTETYRFTVDNGDSDYIGLYLYDAWGNQLDYAGGNPNAALSSMVLNAGTPYYIGVYPNNRFQAFQLQVTMPAYSISLDSGGDYTFPNAAPGYGAPAVKTVTVSNTGTQATGALVIGKSGADAGSFTVSKTAISDIAAGGSDSFTVVPVTGLGLGTYAATITISGGNGISVALNVSFTVAPIHTVTFNAAGGTPDMLTAQTSPGGATVSLPSNPAKDGYNFGGWYTEMNGGGQPFTGNTRVTGDRTVYAKWIGGGVKVVIGVADERIDLTRDKEDVLSKERGDTLRLTAPLGYDGYTWYLDGYNYNYTLISETEIEVPAVLVSYYGTHSVLLEFEKDGVHYGCEVLFMVVR